MAIVSERLLHITGEDFNSGHTWPKSAAGGGVPGGGDRSSRGGGGSRNGVVKNTPVSSKVAHSARGVGSGGEGAGGGGGGGADGRGMEIFSADGGALPMSGRGSGKLRRLVGVGGGGVGNAKGTGGRGGGGAGFVESSGSGGSGGDRVPPFLSVTLGGVHGVLPDVRWSVQQRRLRMEDSGIVK